VKKKEPTFKFKAKDIPASPGCYLFFGKKDQLLYVGKAKNLRKRVSSYFQKNKKTPKTKKLIDSITKIETRIVNSEMEALILENNLIKQYQPKFNILLRDDKNFLYLKVTNENFPRIEITRRIKRDGSFYFGPKTSAQKFRKTIQFCQKVFQIRTCRLEIKEEGVISNPENRRIPCLDFHIKKCSAPCLREITQTEYKKNVETMKKFLRGNTKEVLQSLQEKMMKFATEKNFEAAVKIRDLIQSIETSTEKQTVQFTDSTDRDFLNFVREEKCAYFVRIAFRNGKLLHQNEIEFYIGNDGSDSEIIEQFCLQFYEKIDEPPHEIFIPEKIDKPDKISRYLSEQFFTGSKIEILVPQKGPKKSALEIAKKNAKNFAEKSKLEQMSQAENFSKALPLLAEALKLSSPPSRMECYDISHLGGTNTVASQVVFVDGKPQKSEYKRYKIKNLPDGKIDDFAAMNEVLSRRFAKINIKQRARRRVDTKTNIPDLIIIDGGKGQLSAVMAAVKDFKFPKKFIPCTQIIALAKQEEQIFRPKVKEPLELPHDSPALKLLQRIRDEAHRMR